MLDEVNQFVYTIKNGRALNNVFFSVSGSGTLVPQAW